MLCLRGLSCIGLSHLNTSAPFLHFRTSFLYVAHWPWSLKGHHICQHSVRSLHNLLANSVFSVDQIQTSLKEKNNWARPYFSMRPWKLFIKEDKIFPVSSAVTGNGTGWCTTKKYRNSVIREKWLELSESMLPVRQKGEEKSRKEGRKEGSKSQLLRCDFQVEVDQGWGEAILWPHSEQSCHYESDNEWRCGAKLRWWAKKQGERGGEGQDTEALPVPSFSLSLKDRDTAEGLALPALEHG